MKTHALAHQLEIYAKLLRSLPDSEIEDALTTLLTLIESKGLEAAKVTNRKSVPLPEGVEDRLRQMTLAEIEQYLDSEAESFSAARLLELAERLGVSTSKRQSRSALVNLIIRHFESSQMDSMIRATRKDES